jgi:NAD(P)-dependent dehydrogenase (short-subunit alcohol dehydrogenase family)
MLSAVLVGQHTRSRCVQRHPAFSAPVSMIPVRYFAATGPRTRVSNLTNDTLRYSDSTAVHPVIRPLLPLSSLSKPQSYFSFNAVITNVRLSMYFNRVMGARYPETKLLNVQFVRGLTARLPSSTPIVVTSVNPGFCHSELVRNMRGIVRVVVTIMQALLARSTETGSRTLVWAALAGLDGLDANLRDHMRGVYTEDCKIVEPSSFLFSPAGKAVEPRIWVRRLLRRLLNVNVFADLGWGLE